MRNGNVGEAHGVCNQPQYPTSPIPVHHHKPTSCPTDSPFIPEHKDQRFIRHNSHAGAIFHMFTSCEHKLILIILDYCKDAVHLGEFRPDDMVPYEVQSRCSIRRA